MPTPGDCVVLDQGSGSVKAGFAGEVEPRLEIQPLVGWRESQDGPSGLPTAHLGSELRAVWDEVRVCRVVERGLVDDWDGAEALLDYTLRKALKVEPAEHPVLLTEPALNPKQNREKITEILMEKIGCGGIYLSVPGVLSLYSMGQTSGVVLDAGYGHTSVVPVFQGYQLRSGTRVLPIGGADLTEKLMQMLLERGYNLDATKDLPTVNAIKEQLAYVAKDFDWELSEASVEGCPNMREVYTLPDGATVDIDKERFSCAEALFQPCLSGKNFDGVHVATVDGIVKCDRNVHDLLFDYVLLAGGATCIKGLEERLYKEMLLLAPPTKKIRIISPKIPKRKISAWTGGSVLTALSSFSQSYVHKWEYNEVGPAIIHRKCF